MVYENSIWAELKRNYIEGSMSMKESCEMLRKQGKKVPSHATVERRAMTEKWRELRLGFIQKLDERLMEDLMFEKTYNFKLRQKAKRKYEKALDTDPDLVPSGSDNAAFMKLDMADLGQNPESVGISLEIQLKDYGKPEESKVGDNTP